MGLRFWLFCVVLVQLCPLNMPTNTKALMRAGNSCSLSGLEPLLDVPDLIRTYPMMLHRFTDIADFVLGIAMDYVNLHNYDHVPFPDVEKSLTITVKGLSYQTTFRGTHGWIEDLSTLRRVGEVSTSKYRRGAISITVGLSFKSLTVGFDKYTLPIAYIAQLGGYVNIKVNDNKFIIKTLVTVDEGGEKCTFSLEDVKIEKLGNFRATISGLWPFNWLLQVISNAIIQGNKSVVRAELESKFRTEARKFLNGVPCGNVCYK